MLAQEVAYQQVPFLPSPFLAGPNPFHQPELEMQGSWLPAKDSLGFLLKQGSVGGTSFC